MDCGFFIESAVLALACVGLCAAVIELRCLCLRRRLGARLQVTARLDCSGAAGGGAPLIWAAGELLRLRWPGARLRIEGAAPAAREQACIIGGGQGDGAAGAGKDRGDGGSPHL